MRTEKIDKNLFGNNSIDSISKQIELVLPKDFTSTVYSKNNKTFFVSVDNNVIMMLYTSIDIISDKPYEKYMPKIPELDYVNSGTFAIDYSNQKSFLKDLIHNDNVKDIVCYKPYADGNIYLAIRGEDWITNELSLIGNTLKFKNDNIVNEELLTHYDYHYVKKAFRILNSLNKSNVNKSLQIKFKNDYPLCMSIMNNELEYTIMIASMIVDREWKSKDLIDVKFKR